jgi:arsenate reductase
MAITIYEKPTCTTCRQVHAALVAAGVDVTAVNYYVDPIPRPKLEELIRKMGITPRQLLRTKEHAYRTLGLADASVTDAQILDAMVAHPDLIQRPIVEQGDRAILARPADRLREFL